MLSEQLKPATADRVLRSLAVRTQAAGADAFTAAPHQIDNGDEARYADKSGTYTKGVLQSGIGVVDLRAYASFKRARERFSRRFRTHRARRTAHA